VISPLVYYKSACGFCTCLIISIAHGYFQQFLGVSKVDFNADDELLKGVVTIEL